MPLEQRHPCDLSAAAASPIALARADLPLAESPPEQKPTGREDAEEDEGEEQPAKETGEIGCAAHSASESDDDEDSSRRRSGRRRGPSLAGTVSFLQVLVFGTLMLQALTVFVTYHMLLSTQHSHGVLATLGSRATDATATASPTVSATSLPTGQLQMLEAIESLREEIRLVAAQVRAVSATLADEVALAEAEAAADDSLEKYDADDAEREHHARERSASATAAQAVGPRPVPNWNYPNGSCDIALLDALVEDVEAGRLGPKASRVPRSAPRVPRVAGGDTLGGNYLMDLRAEDLTRLHRYRNWTDDALGRPFDAGHAHNQTAAIMRKLGQLDDGDRAADIVILEHRPDDRTTVAARAIRRGEYFFKIHQDYLLTSIVVEHSAVGRELVAAGAEPDEMVWMTVFVLYEKHDPTSYWKFWIHVLPANYRHMPATFARRGELELIDGTTAAEWTAEYQTQYRKEYVALAHHLRAMNFAQFTFAEYVWARCAVASRAFGLDVYRAKKAPGSTSVAAAAAADGGDTEDLELVHLTCMAAADLINHEGEDRKIDAVWGWNEQTRQFAFKAMRDIAAGAPIHTTYGPRGNSDLLVHYGFALPHNPFNVAGVCLAASRNDAAFASKQRMLVEAFGGGDREDAWAQCAAGIRLPTNSAPGFRCRLQQDMFATTTQECLRFARVAVADTNELAQHIAPQHARDLRTRAAAAKTARADDDEPEDAKWAILEMGPIGFQNEMRAIQTIGEFASYAADRIVGGPSSNDTGLLVGHATAAAAGLCDAVDSSASPDRWFPFGPCLTYNQQNLLWVRLGEKSVLEQAATMARHASAFVALAPTTVAHAYDFLDRLVAHTTDSADQTASLSRDAILRYFNEVVLPLYFDHRGWFDPQTRNAADARDSHERRREQYRALYRTAPHSSDEREDERFSEFSFDQP